MKKFSIGDYFIYESDFPNYLMIGKITDMYYRSNGIKTYDCLVIYVDLRDKSFRWTLDLKNDVRTFEKNSTIWEKSRIIKSISDVVAELL